MTKKIKPVLTWGGFVDGKLDFRTMDTGLGGYGGAKGKKEVAAVFRHRISARQEYQDVRRVEIRPTPRAVGR